MPTNSQKTERKYVFSDVLQVIQAALFQVPKAYFLPAYKIRLWLFITFTLNSFRGLHYNSICCNIGIISQILVKVAHIEFDKTYIFIVSEGNTKTDLKRNRMCLD